MPKLYEYFGITIFFYGKEHPPIHVHGRYSGQESKIEFIVEDGEIKKIRIKNVRGKKPLPKKQLRDFEHLTKKLSYEIIQTWVDYFVFKKTIVTKKIERKL